MRVMHVIDPAPYGGAEAVVSALSTARRPETVVAALVDRDDHAFVTELTQAGVVVDVIVTRHRQYLKQVRLVADGIRRRGVDCVHTHVYHADAVGYLAARRTGRPVVTTYHGSTGGGLRNRWYEWGDRWLLRRFDAVVCVSEAIRRRLLAAGASADRLHVVPNGMLPVQRLARSAARARLGIPADAPVIGWIGRMSAEKGPDLFVAAMEQITHPRTLAVMIGDGPERRLLQDRVSTARLGDRVRFAGSHPGAARLLPAFDVLAISSRTEGLPMVLLEAIDAGIPVVAFPVGGLSEYLNDTTAWLAPPGDARALAGSLDSALGRPAEREVRVRAAQAMAARQLSLEGWVAAVERVYRAALARHTAGA